MADTEKSEVAKREEAILAFWKEKGVFEKTLGKDAPKGEFVFYDGPPFATGLPHSGSLLSSVSKDLIPRYKTMRGYRVRRRWGWDTHGLPIESLVEKKLGLKNKKEILEIGIEKFNETARSMVLEYVHDWKRYVERVGRFVDFDNSYKTMDNTFIESVWWGLKEIHKKGRLYEGRKVLMYCPHCETPLAKAEIAMDNTYKDVTEETATVAFRVVDSRGSGLPENAYLLAWTTTPWTLPGNVGLAVGSDIAYGVYEKDGKYLVAAKERAEALGLSNATQELTGSVLVGVTYEPLYEIPKVARHAGKKWEVLSADFVTTTDGTGIVHTAVIYGEDDYQLGVKEGLPMVPILNPNATYNDDAPLFLRGKYIKKAESEIKEDLESRGLLFAREMHTHSYPHCYRCGTALIYNAVSSWFIDIQAVKERMLAENEKITWVPEHLKHGRFRHIVESAPDWTISRNRFWASPLPIWKGADGSVHVIGSLAELKERTKKSGNRYLAMRHGETENTLISRLSSDPTKNPLTEKGRERVRARAQELKTNPPTRIFASPVLRTRESAEIICEELGLPKDKLVFDERLRELTFGEFEERYLEEFLAWRNAHAYDEAPEGGESGLEAKRRFGEFLYELERTYANEIILIVTHGIGLESFTALADGLENREAKELIESSSFSPAEVIEVPFVPLPHNRDFTLDYHLPYIDRVSLVDEAGEPLTRIPEVVDCWVESGSMPFAEYHYPFENKEAFEKRTPGDFISEYIGQTRAWFYYMHAISLELFDHLAFRNVITTGNVLAADGAKLSKSKNNYTDPYLLFEKYGADAFRYTLMSSVVMQAEDLTFRDDDVKDAHARVVNMLRNIYGFFEIYKDELAPDARPSAEHPLDRWIQARLDALVTDVTDSFDRYDVPRGVRAYRDFIDDLSNWYVRRSRDRAKGEDEGDKQRMLAMLRSVLATFSKTIAPVMPFIAEEIYQGVRRESDPESVHLASWPSVEKGIFDALSGKAKKDAMLLEEMKRTRTLASEALRLRQKADLKVRQPLASLSIPGTLPIELAKILSEELNVKEIRMNAEQMALDTELTPELIAEGDERAFQRAVAEARKAEGFSPKDHATVTKREDGAHVAELSTGPVRFSLSRDAS
ncbi:MAG TPA: class I tRNA ligase family protein [Candidatus Paceibacterota bacterium]